MYEYVVRFDTQKIKPALAVLWGSLKVKLASLGLNKSVPHGLPSILRSSAIKLKLLIRQTRSAVFLYQK
jgi:hypothetical protein